MKFAVAVVLACVSMVSANPINLWGSHGSVIAVPSAVSVQSSVVNHGLSLPVVARVVTPVVARPIVPVVRTVVSPVVTAPIGLGWNGLGWNGLGWNGLGWNGLGWNGLGWGKGLH